MKRICLFLRCVLQEILNRFGLEYSVGEDEDDQALEEALKEAIAQADAGLGRPHVEVMASIRGRSRK